LNCVANGKLLRDKSFEKIWVQPAAGDAGGALGAALGGYHLFKQQPRQISATGDAMRGGYLGPVFKQDDVERRLSAMGARFKVLSDEETIEYCAQSLAKGQAVGWHQGRMEFGPR